MKVDILELLLEIESISHLIEKEGQKEVTPVLVESSKAIRLNFDNA